MTDETPEQRILRELSTTIASTLASHAAELKRLNGNLEAAHAASQRLAEAVMGHAQVIETHTAALRNQAGAIAKLFELAGHPLPSGDEPPAPGSVN